jgi:hypothetical protein
MNSAEQSHFRRKGIGCQVSGLPEPPITPLAKSLPRA